VRGPHDGQLTAPAHDQATFDAIVDPILRVDERAM
jgi:hypothetical protein